MEAYAPRPAHPGRKMLTIPYFGLTAAGIPKDITTYPNRFIQFPAKFIRNNPSECFSLEVCGTSMTEAGINDGDTVLMRRAEAPENGAIMAIRYEDQSTVKRVRIRGNRVFLCWEDGSNFLRLIPPSMRFRGNSSQ